MAVQGIVRLRKHQFGRQGSMGTVVAAKRAYPFKGVPSNDLAWTDPDIDAGSIAPVAAPYHGAFELTAPLNFPVLYYNDLPLLLCGFFGGGVTPSTVATTGRQWDFAPAAVAPLDDPDLFSYEFGDDVTTDWFQLGDGLIETFEITGPDGGGACTASLSWRFGSFGSSGSTDYPDSPTVPTGGLDLDINGIPVYMKDLGIYIASNFDYLAGSQILDALHTFTLRGTQEYDLKRYANGGPGTFDIDAYGRGARSIELEATFAKTSDTVGLGSESDAWMSETAVNRWCELKWTSAEAAAVANPYSLDVQIPMRYYTRTETEIGGNTAIVLTGHSFYDPDDLGGDITASAMTTLDNANF